MVIIRNDCTVLCVLPFSFSENSSFHISCIPHVLFFLDVSFYNDALAADFVWRVVLIVAVVLRISEYKNDILYISSFQEWYYNIRYYEMKSILLFLVDEYSLNHSENQLIKNIVIWTKFYELRFRSLSNLFAWKNLRTIK